MERREIERKAFDYFQASFICAEAISLAIIEAFAEEGATDLPRVATGLGGGVGGTKCETCGALTGGVLALGFFFGRMDPTGDRLKVYEQAAEFRSRFVDAFGATTCQAILSGLGPQENLGKCKELTAQAAGILFDLVRPALAGRR